MTTDRPAKSAAFDLTGRSAIVTGAASGIGRATAIVLAEAGALVVCVDIDRAGSEATARGIADLGGLARSQRIDVTSSDHMDALVTSVVEQCGALDIMCNIAGIMHESPVLDTTAADLDRVFRVNFKGVLFGCQAAARVMIERGSGSIINMSSAVADSPAPNTLCYAASKAAIGVLTCTLAAEIGEFGVRVNSVAPGFVNTAITQRHFTLPDGSLDEIARDATFARMAARAPIARIGEPVDVANTILFLASDASSFMTGQVLRPNGGIVMR